MPTKPQLHQKAENQHLLRILSTRNNALTSDELAQKNKEMARRQKVNLKKRKSIDRERSRQENQHQPSVASAYVAAETFGIDPLEAMLRGH